MAKARKILARRKAVGSIHTVTRTMEMVATAQFKRTFNRCLSARGYLDGVSELADDVIAKTPPKNLRHPLLAAGKPTAPHVLLIVTSDRGLCGGYNSSILNRALRRRDELVKDAGGVQLHVIGKTGLAELKYAGEKIEKHHKELDPTGHGGWYRITRLADAFMAEFLDGRIAGLDVAYSTLIGSAKHEPTIHTLLPMRMIPKEKQPEPEKPPPVKTDEWETWEPYEPYEPYEPLKPYAPPTPPRFEYEFVPSPAELFKRLLPMTLRLRLFQCFLEAAVTEQIARMTAMRAAGDSAEEMIRDLTIQYNRTRQGQITTELAEILGGRLALQ
ncbi:MAG: ATP synthase F1 subunit gamma [Phycisphaerae bacterium]|nr:ATP synthase F1 subunit gamma [Phycisphaerae bacterium]